MEEKQSIDNSNEQISTLREQLCAMQDKWSEQEQRAEAAEKKVAALEQQVSTFSDIIKNSRRELKAQKKEQQKSAHSHKTKMREAVNTNIDLEKTAEKHAREAEALRKQCQELQLALDKALEVGFENSSFNSEGIYQKLYKETLTEMEQLQEKHRREIYSQKTKLQNAEETIVNLKAEAELIKTKMDILTSSYEQASREDQKKIKLLEEQIRSMQTEEDRTDSQRFTM